MFAISFDMSVSDLRKYYNKDYTCAYYEIKQIMKSAGFEWVQGSTYHTSTNDMSSIVKVIMTLSKIEWFKRSVRDIRGYKIEDWSDFTELVKE